MATTRRGKAKKAELAPSYTVTSTTGETTVGSKPNMKLKSNRKRKPSAASNPALAYIYLSLLSLQFGLQPTLNARYTPQGVNKTLIIVIQEFFKCVLAFSMLMSSGHWSQATRGWSLQSYVNHASIPSVLYSLQNYLLLLAYQNLEPVEFNVLNQTKTLSAAVWCYILMGRRQSSVQVASLFMLMIAAVMIEGSVDLSSFLSGGVVSVPVVDAGRLFRGVLPCLAASGISGLAGAVTQRILQDAKAPKNR